MKNTALVLLCLCTLQSIAQTDSLQAMEEVLAFQKNLNEEYKDSKKSPLELSDFLNFQGHDFFPVDLSYRVHATLRVTDGTPFFAMKTTTSRLATERIYGYVSFTLKGREFELPVYQSKDLMTSSEYADYLFFPFTDDTNGVSSYAGGRYMDLRIPKESNKLIIDFNMAYNPYCAYSPRYSCPIVPAENDMDIEVPVGVRYQKLDKGEAADMRETDSAIFTKVEVMPEYPGGYEAMINFIRHNMTYPRAAVKRKIQGVVYVHFIVETDGSITDIKTLRGISKECDEEAERVVAMMPRWKPGQVDGKDVAVKFVLPIAFKGRPGWAKN